MEALHLDAFIAAHPDLGLKPSTIRAWLKLWDDKPSRGILSPDQQTAILGYVEHVSNGNMSQDDYAQQMKAERLSQQVGDTANPDYDTAQAFIDAERNLRIADGITLGAELARDFLNGVDKGFSANLPRAWNERFNNQSSPYRMAQKLMHGKLQELRESDNQRYRDRLQAVPFAIDPASVYALPEGDE